MISCIDQNLKQYVPYYEKASTLTLKTYKQTFNTVSEIQHQVEGKITMTKENVLKIRQNLETQIMALVQQTTNQILSRTQKLLLSEQELSTETDKKQLKKRVVRLYNKLLKDYVVYYAQQAQKYNQVLIKRGQQYYTTYVLPMYIKIKATIIVAKEVFLEWLELGLDDMKMTYDISKDYVTMLIRGQFEEDKIVQKISSGMENFKQLTVKVVKKGLEIKVDKKSLYENYEMFSLKVFEMIRQMREKGTEKIVSAKQKTTQLYKSVLNRIREKEITLKLEYKELNDKKETQLQPLTKEPQEQ